MEDEEKIIFELIDQLDAEKAELELIGSSAYTSQPLTEREAASIQRIKARTISKLQLEKVDTSPLPTVHSSRRRRIAVVAAVIAFLLVAVEVGSTPSVQAELNKVLRFLPGFGMVREGDLTQLTYVLEKPYVQEIGVGRLTVDGIALESNFATITLRGEQTAAVKEFKAEISGRKYTFTYSTLASSGDWYGNYIPTRGTHVPVSDTITLYINGTTIGPLKLDLPKTADDLEHLGSSSEQQDVRITAFPTRVDDGIVRVQLISKLPQQSLTVQSYGVSPLVEDTGLYVEDADGTKAELVKSETLTYPSDFRFHETPIGGVLPYTVVVPFIEVSDREAISKEVSILLPDVGVERTIEVPAEVSGFPVRFTRIKRTSDTTVILDVDIQFDPSKPRGLQYFLIRYPGSKFNNSFSWENVNKTSAVMKTLQLETKPGETLLRFSLAEPHYLIKGPWRLPLKFE
ncbi:hypothetical protein SAMN03159341_10322 [Paenibacillus sp. 1_12]|uniref:DUF4179 domain-containing protein n=1 Tax=Paenibacillus sp. 1_12 TaxID=1566278 RepID=UPI0008F1EEAC|nr:DUF4179 domain-containing protein [Paenibacillus sp. 1_12]SFL06301.1 hypothetical protein SAMN03159341_10322 [Paenibacillus sp. 1_12]